MTTVLLILGVVILLSLLTQSRKKTEVLTRLERRIDSALPPEVFSAKVQAAARQPGTAGLISAIKQYREETGAGLEEAKSKIEALRQKLGSCD